MPIKKVSESRAKLLRTDSLQTDSLRQKKKPLEMWGGIECTVNRVGECYFNQMKCNGHAERLSDLETFAELGIKALRYPVLWELFAPTPCCDAALDWSWSDVRLNRLRDLGIRPIVGLVHHGSGPRHTSLVDENFATGLAQHARGVAERYPWVEAYTPVNEPLTTARFSGLYGHWYPHGHDDATFTRALLNECRATVLAMREIRRVNPQAQLIQTDDLGRIKSTARLSYQADFENERRWLAFDLLCGKVGRSHPMYGYLRWAGMPERDIEWFLENPCPPNVIGINHYVSSDRYLDEDLGRYPVHTHGGNGREHYADVETVRVGGVHYGGFEQALRDAWDRYGLPLAVTETHLGCTREEQLRWLFEVWNTARGLKEDGVDLRAVTVWSLLGSFNWDSVVTCDGDHYEPGVFDVRGPQPRPTALAQLVRELSMGEDPAHPVLHQPGWWRRPDRILYPPQPRLCHALAEPSALTEPSSKRPAPLGERDKAARPLLIAGATGTLGRAFARLCDVRGLPYYLVSRREMDLTDPMSLEVAIEAMRPWAVINATGYVRVDEAECNEDDCFAINATGAIRLAEVCAWQGVSLLNFSSDLVFDGTLGRDYVESDRVCPLNAYGRSKVAMEAGVLAALPSSLVVRTSAFFGPWDQYNFVTCALNALERGEPFIAAEDVCVSPTYVVDLVNACLDLLIDEERGIRHLANQGATSWADLARAAAKLAGRPDELIEGCPAVRMNWPAPRPAQSVLSSERGQLLPALEDALERFVRDRERN